MDTIQGLAQIAVEATGLGVALMGLISFSEGKSNNSSAQQSEGVSKMIGGGVIFAAGLTVIPAIFSMITL